MKFGFAELGPTQMLLMLGLWTGASGSALAAIHIEGEVQANGAPLANSTVALWQASDGAPRQLAQTKAGSDGRFEIKSQETPGAAGVLYLVSGNSLGLRIAGGMYPIWSTRQPGVGGKVLPDQTNLTHTTTLANLTLLGR